MVRFLKITDTTNKVRLININNIVEMRKSDGYGIYEVVVRMFRNHTHEVIRMKDDDYADLLKVMVAEHLIACE